MSRLAAAKSAVAAPDAFAALELTGDNRASAAEILGLSRQSLYAKLRRHGIADIGSESAQNPG